MAKKKYTAKDIENALILSQSIVSLDTPLSDDSSEKSEDLLSTIVDPRPTPEEKVMLDFRKEYLLSFMDKYLRPREKQVLMMRFGFEDDPKTLEEIGEELNICRERVRQIEKNALNKMRYRFLTNNINRGDI